MITTLQQTLDRLGLQLPAPIKSPGLFQITVPLGDQVFVSGLGPIVDGNRISGKVGADLNLEAAQKAARAAMLLILACVDEAHGLENIERCVRMTVYVRAESTFTKHTQVANGASEVLALLFGTDRLPARSAIGVHTLPAGFPVEIDSIFQLKPKVEIN